MARLPTPGSDDGTWGGILNDYLGQALDTDGTLKTNAVGTNAVQNGAVTEVKLASAVQTKLNATPDPTMGGDLTGPASNAQLAASSVDATALAANAVITAKILDSNITAAKLATDAVTTVKIADSNVTTAKIQASAITTAKIADGSVTAAKLDPAVGGADSLRSLLIYYAPPNVLNGKFDDDYAAAVLSRYDDVVLGTGLEDPASPYYASTTAIISKVAALAPDTIIWGYIDTGVTTGNFSLPTLQTQIDQWVAIGARGIFCDVIGYAYGVSRARQNSIINYIHSKNIGAILNVFNPDETLSPAVDATYNPGGTPTVADSRDILLIESWVFNSDAYATPHYTTFSDIKTRGDAARAYRASLGIRLYSTNIISHTGRTENELAGYRGVAEALARIWRLDGSGVAVSSYASSGADAGLAVPRFPSLRPSPPRRTAPYTLNGGWTQVEAPDLGITVNYDTGTHTWQQL